MAIYTKREMNTGRYIRTIILILALFIGATNEAWALSQADIIFDPASPEGGTVAFKSIDGQTVTITVTPGEGFYVKISDIIVQKLQDPSQAQARRRTPGIADRLTVSGAQESDEAADYTFEVPTGYAGALVNVTFTSKVKAGYYVLHQNGKGYLKVHGPNVVLANDATLRYADLYTEKDNGNAFWVMTDQGYLQNNIYYLNVTPVSNELYLSVKPVTRWRQEDISGDTHGKKHIVYNGLYLCNDNDKIKLSASPSAYYNACPVKITERSWSGPTNGDLIVQSPQLVTYLRYYFTQKFDYEYYDDSGSETKQSGSNMERRVYATLEYASSTDANKGTTWDVSSDNRIIYSMQTSGDVAVTATYNLLPADAEALKQPYNHNVATQKAIKLTLKPQAFNPDASKKYLLYSIPGGDSYRFPLDDGIAENGTVKSNGAKSALSDPDVNGGNAEISWKIVKDDNDGLYTFQNVNTNRYLYYNDALGDYGKICVGATTLPTGEDLKKYKFRLYQTSATDFGTCYYIIPYDKQFAVYKNDAITGSIYCALNEKSYTSDNSISLRIGNDDSKWRIYTYEAEYRLNDEFSINGGTTASTTGDYTLTAETYYSKNIKDSPKTGGNKRALEINGSYDTSTQVYPWSVTGLNGYATYSHSENSSKSKSTLTITVTSLPISSVSGTVSLKVTGGTDPNKKSSSTKTVAFTIQGDGTITLTEITTLSQINNGSGAYKLTADQTYSDSNKPGPDAATFSGILDCDGHTISGLTAPLFTTLTNGTVRNLNLSGVEISQAGAVGAIASTANGGSRIYNVGILDGSLQSTGTSTADNGTDCCGGIVGLLDGSARVINCFSYAEIKGGNRVGGIVGYNNYKSTMTDLRTMVVNCMFYGDITGGTAKYPVYGGKKISNSGTLGINNYNYFLETATFDDSYTSIDNYNCSWPVGERYLTRYEIYRNILNSNRRLCTWWVRDVNSTAPTDADVESVGIAKWVLDPAIAPYPILKTWGKYPSVVNPDPNQRVDPTTKEWTNRSSSDKWGTNDAPETEGQILESVNVTIKGGSNNSLASDSRDINITAMDTEYKDYCYGKIQLPYYNEIFGNPEGATWAAKYGNNYTSKVVTGWKITKVNGSTTGSGPDFVEDWESGYNFADRTSTKKDLFDISGRVFAQGGFYYVPDGVTSIEIEAYWGDAVYLCNNGRNLDRMNIGANEFTVSGTLPEKVGGESTNPAVKTSLKDAVTALTAQPNKTVYDQAVVLVGNYQDNAFHGAITLKGSEYSTKAKPFTIMSADFDFDNEPDFCFQGGMSGGGRINSHPIRFDFVMVPDITLAIRTNANYYGMRIFCPQGHFEITETSYMYCTQFEYEERNADTYLKTEAPMILNGGEFMQIVSSEAYTVTSANATATDRVDKTSYFLMGGHVYMHAFSPGCHGNKNIGTRHCAVNAIGGEYPKFYLSGMFNNSFYNMTDNPHAYLDGGYFGIVAGAGTESVGGKDETTGGDVTFKINHSIIDEFYGGGINANRPVTGNISVTVDNSYVKKFCGGPMLGDMSNNKSITTDATGTTFDEFYGGGNGGTNNERIRIYDSGGGVTAPTVNDASTSWNGDYAFNTFDPLRFVDGGYETEFEFEMLPYTNGSSNVVKRTYHYIATFSKTTVAPVTNNITDCTFNGDFYGGGNLGAIAGPANATTPVVSSTLQGNTVVHGSAFGAGFSASIPSFQVHDRSTTAYPYRDFAGFIHDGSLEYGETFYTWIHDVPAEWNISPAPATNNDNRKFIYDGKSYVYTPVSLSGLGTVTGDVELTIKGNTIVECKVFKEDGTVDNEKIGGVYGGGAQSAVNGNTTVNLLENAQVYGDVFGGGDEGVVEGTATVNIGEIPTSTSGSGSGSGGDEPGGGSGD